MHHFNGTRSRHRGFDRPTASLGRHEYQSQSQPFARAQESISHRLGQMRRAIRIELHTPRQRGINETAQMVGLACGLLFSRRGHVLSRKTLRTWRERIICDFRRKTPF